LSLVWRKYWLSISDSYIYHCRSNFYFLTNYVLARSNSTTTLNYIYIVNLHTDWMTVTSDVTISPTLMHLHNFNDISDISARMHSFPTWSLQKYFCETLLFSSTDLMSCFTILDRCVIEFLNHCVYSRKNVINIYLLTIQLIPNALWLNSKATKFETKFPTECSDFKLYFKLQIIFIITLKV